MLLRPFLTKMSKEGLDCVDIDMEQSDGGNAVELNEAAAPSPNLFGSLNVYFFDVIYYFQTQTVWFDEYRPVRSL